MIIEKDKKPSQTLQNAIILGLEDKKGKDIVVLDLSKINEAVTETFIICTGESNTQVNALAESVEKTVREKTGEKPWHIEGKTNAEWVLLDYVDVVVHIFQKNFRDFYNIEELWNDAEIIKN